MRLTLNLPEIACPDNIRPFLLKVLAGEYDIPLDATHQLTVLDIGANCGAFSVWAAHRWPGSLIHAYEPNPDLFGYLAENTQRYPNVRVNYFGLGKPGMRLLYDGAFNCGEASLYERAGNPAPTGRHVEIRSPSELPQANILKCDAEGAEIEIIPELIDLGRTYQVIMLEYHSESIRRLIDSKLTDYILIGSEFMATHRGVLKYLHRNLLS